ncbi:MAG: hydrolase [Thermoprotei archaeon]|nr:MAG: hydrolase [Thermoprotei archaeon]
MPVELGELIAEVKRVVWGIYRGVKLPPSHDFSHVLRVVELAGEIAEGEGLNERERGLVTLAALLHDVGIALRGTKEGHAAASAEYAKKLLVSRLNDGEVELVVTAVREHSWEGATPPSSTISAVLQDADRLDALGAIGLARVFAYSGYVGRPLYCLEAPFPEDRELRGKDFALDHIYEKLLRIPERLNTRTARALAEGRVAFIRAFLEELRREIRAMKTGF